MFGRRPDGRRVKGIDPVMRITPYVMPMRCDAQVMLKHRADMENLSAYIRKQKRENGQKISYMQIIVAAYVRALSRNPEVNRFIKQFEQSQKMMKQMGGMGKRGRGMFPGMGGMGGFGGRKGFPF